jgi:hypothetical protein
MKDIFRQKLQVVLILSILTLLTLLSRIPFVGHFLYNWDSVQFALALKKFDITQHQPHPPGYFFYVMLGKLINYFIQDPNLSFIILSIIMSILAIIFFYFFCLNLYNHSETKALVITLFFLFSPIFWFFGEVASTYIADALFSILISFLIWQTITKKKNYSFLVSIILGLASGIRNSLIVLFLPLWLLMLLQLRPFKKILFNSLLLILSAFSWLLPLINLSGGFKSYFETTSSLFNYVGQKTSIFKGVALIVGLKQTTNVLRVLLVGINVLIFSIIFAGYLWFKRKLSINKSHITFYLFWILPSLFVYCLIHFGHVGYVLTILPALFLILGSFLFSFKQLHKKLGLIIIVLVIIAELYIFLFIPSNLSNIELLVPHSIFQKVIYFIYYFNRNTISQNDQIIKNYINTIIKENPETTILITEKGALYTFEGKKIGGAPWFRHIMYYLPKFPVYQIFIEKEKKYYLVQNYSDLNLIKKNTIPISPKINKFIWITDRIDEDILKNLKIQQKKLGLGKSLYYLETKDNFEYKEYKFIFEK